MKKNIYLITFFLFLSSFTIKAQKKDKGYRKVRAYKIAYLTEKLDLTESEAQKFWPIYNDYNKKMAELRKEKHLNIKNRILKDGNLDDLSEKQAKEIIKKTKQLEKEQYTTKTKFSDKITSFLPYKKILILEITEHEFHRKMFNRLKRKRNKLK